jgi:acyl-CoA reductase-like NAD-dependent aldehyde dehydrogenase
LAYADAIEANITAFAKTLTMEQGKPLDQAITELGMTSQWIRALSDIEIPETIIEETDDRKILQRYIPMGVVGAIVPWNSPVLFAIRKIIPAMYTGNTVIVKPSPFTLYCDLKLAELATRFFPPGVVQCLSGDDTLGPMITKHPGITRKRVMASYAETLTRLTVEFGGNDPAIICDDVDIETIIPKVFPLPTLVLIF